MGKGGKEKEIKPWSVKSDKKTAEDDKKVIKKAIWVGQQPNEIEDEGQGKGIEHATEKAMELIPEAVSTKLKGTKAHISTKDEEDTQKVTSIQIFADAEGKKYLGTLHAHNDGTGTYRLKGQKTFKKL
ncbi:hypothetical protein KC343_g1236 [Hortaea werneckii]|nr:hypothetical protein KC323_g4027 [Hortaea werneckii]KAI6875517.1 hypothetical protein KC338_g755 [Hortaea werneckii]KAI7277263.1 hypothetical protein KC352_g7821 [Hortaea werneckii]KAI7359068.1 hypothetical protein KC320_g766 [Hortaea werneckii]KAI7571677.1 hypothetical protein KC317_g1432 [Hortaea werneckii]